MPVSTWAGPVTATTLAAGVTHDADAVLDATAATTATATIAGVGVTHNADAELAMLAGLTAKAAGYVGRPATNGRVPRPLSGFVDRPASGMVPWRPPVPA